jgi:hypothetical protein
MTKSPKDIKRHIRAELDSGRMLKFYKIKFAMETIHGKLTNDEVVGMLIDSYKEIEIAK